MSLQLQNIQKEYLTRSGPLKVLDGVSLTLNRGDALAIMGPSGSGKSTLLHIMGTLDFPTAGTLQLDGIAPFGLNERDLAAFRNRRIGFVFQDHHLLPQCSVLENVLIPTLVNREANKMELAKSAKELLDRVGLAHRIDHRPAELSGGERQRVAVARALIQKPLLVLADEPTGNLDRASAVIVGKLLIELNQQEQSILVTVTHSPDLAALFGKRHEMDDGRLT